MNGNLKKNIVFNRKIFRKKQDSAYSAKVEEKILITFEIDDDWMTRRTLVVVWGVGPSLGRGRGVTRPDFAAGPFPEGATLPHFFPGHF